MLNSNLEDFFGLHPLGAYTLHKGGEGVGGGEKGIFLFHQYHHVRCPEVGFFWVLNSNLEEFFESHPLVAYSWKGGGREIDEIFEFSIPKNLPLDFSHDDFGEKIKIPFFPPCPQPCTPSGGA